MVFLRMLGCIFVAVKYYELYLKTKPRGIFFIKKKQYEKNIFNSSANFFSIFILTE